MAPYSAPAALIASASISRIAPDATAASVASFHLAMKSSAVGYNASSWSAVNEVVVPNNPQNPPPS